MLLIFRATGEPNVHIALSLLHFATFHQPHLTTMLHLDGVPILLGLLKGQPDYEMSRSALSLLVTIGKVPEVNPASYVRILQTTEMKRATNYASVVRAT